MDNVIALKANWNETILKLKQKFTLLAVADLAYAEGKQNESLGKLQASFGKSKKEMNRFISTL
jgi:uncharacterized protein YjbJ (UPF0337 family)